MARDLECGFNDNVSGRASRSLSDRYYRVSWVPGRWTDVLTPTAAVMGTFRLVAVVAHQRHVGQFVSTACGSWLRTVQREFVIREFQLAPSAYAFLHDVLDQLDEISFGSLVPSFVRLHDARNSGQSAYGGPSSSLRLLP